ncbi:MAG: hypothetical protein F6K31_03035 [Symploca sp. SIO2G7]|nr:hypothetical protein [Symploca sp. SIO2G7]
MNAEDLLKFIETIEIGSLTPDEKTHIYTTFRKKFLGVEIPETVSQSFSLGGIQAVGGNVNLNVFDTKILLDMVDKIVEKDPEFLIKLAEIIAKRL